MNHKNMFLKRKLNVKLKIFWLGIALIRDCMKKLVIGIDPGVTTGLAIAIDGILKEIQSLNSYQTIEYLQKHKDYIKMVIIEDSSKQSHIWNTKKMNKGTFGRRARNTGSVDGVVRVFKEACEALEIECRLISPLKKGAKWEKHEDFLKYFPSWKNKTNQHTRDAVKCLWCCGECIRSEEHTSELQSH